MCVFFLFPGFIGERLEAFWSVKEFRCPFVFFFPVWFQCSMKRAYKRESARLSPLNFFWCVLKMLSGLRYIRAKVRK